ncbi:MAG: ABC transporter ATP-binding protein [Armatimonadetes bacterium]|nr:ABC transporter ATP-binding protein [Armatimonadota bacterium]
MSALIETTDLTKRYGAVTAVQDLDLQLKAGEVFGLLGPNGSGKTTTILMLLGLTEPTSGTARVMGLDPARKPLEVKRRVGYLPDSVGFYDELSGRENLAYVARLNGLRAREASPAIEQVLNRMGLGNDVGDRAVGAYSRGMRQRLGLAAILLKQVQIAILDEPTLGLDPEAAHEFLEMIRDLRAEGMVVMISSHLLHQVQAVCDRVGLFLKGKMVLEGTVEGLSESVLGGAFRIHVESRGQNVDAILRDVPSVAKVSAMGLNKYRLEAREDCRAAVSKRVIAAGAELLSLTLERPSLDEVYSRYFQEVRHDA